MLNSWDRQVYIKPVIIQSSRYCHVRASNYGPLRAPIIGLRGEAPTRSSFPSLAGSAPHQIEASIAGRRVLQSGSRHRRSVAVSRFRLAVGSTA